MKKLFVCILCLALLMMAGCAADAPEETTASTAPITENVESAKLGSTPLLYRVTDDEGHILYLFGSAHAGFKEMYPLPDYVLDAYESADALALEVNPGSTGASMEEYAAVNEALTLEEGTTIRDYISEQTYTAAVNILKENNQYAAAMEQRTPAMWMLTIDQLIVTKCEATPGYGVDTTMQKMAERDRKPILSAETYVNHHAPFTNISMEQQVALLERVVEAYQDPEVPQLRDHITRLWAVGDKAGMVAKIAVDPFMWGLDAGELTAYQEYWRILGNVRDTQMVQYIKDTLQSGDTVFVCVGVAHVIGQNGIVDQLIQVGYTVEQVH